MSVLKDARGNEIKVGNVISLSGVAEVTGIDPQNKLVKFRVGNHNVYTTGEIPAGLVTVVPIIGEPVKD